MEAAGEAGGEQGFSEGIGLTEQDVAVDDGDALPAVTFDDLGVEQAHVNAPGAAALVGGLQPGSEVGRAGLEVERQAIARKHGQRIGGEALGAVVHQLMNEELSSRPERKGRDQFAAGVAADPPCCLPCGQPQGERQPNHFTGAVELQAEFIELDMD